MKVLVNVFVPAISEDYDLLIPTCMSIREVTTLMTEAIIYLSNNRYISSGQEFICLYEQNILLQDALTLRDYGVRNGDHLVYM